MTEGKLRVEWVGDGRGGGIRVRGSGPNILSPWILKITNLCMYLVGLSKGNTYFSLF